MSGPRRGDGTPTRERPMTNLGRRDLLKLAGLGAGVTVAARAWPCRWGSRRARADWISTSAKPAPLHSADAGADAVASPTPMTDEHGEYLLYEIAERAVGGSCSTRAHRRPRCSATPRVGDGPTVPGPLIKVDQNTAWAARPQRACRDPPDVRLRGRHVRAPARVGVAAAVRRVRRRPDRTRATTRTTGTRTTRGHGRSGTTTTGCTDTRPERLQRPGGAVPPAERVGEGEPLRRARTTSR